MTDLCLYCNEFTRSPCSLYAREYQRAGINDCAYARDPSHRWYLLRQAGLDTDGDFEAAESYDRQQRLEQENAELRTRIAELEG